MISVQLHIEVVVVFFNVLKVKLLILPYIVSKSMFYRYLIMEHPPGGFSVSSLTVFFNRILFCGWVKLQQPW